MTTSRRGLLAALLLAAPVLVGLGYAVLAAFGVIGFGATGWSAARITSVLSERAVWAGLGWSLWVAAASTAIATGAAVIVAVTFRGALHGDRIARALALLPLPIPHLVAGAGAVLLLGQSGYLARLGIAIGLLPGPGAMPPLTYDQAGVGLVFALAWKEFPFLVLVAGSVLSTRGSALEEVGHSLGAGAAAVFHRITWPILWRGMLPAIIAVFIFAAGTFEATALLAPSDPRALPLLTYERYADAEVARHADAFVLVLLGMVVSLVAVAGHEWARSRWERLTG